MVAWLAELTVLLIVAFVKIVRCSKITFAEFGAVQFAVPSLPYHPVPKQTVQVSESSYLHQHDM